MRTPTSTTRNPLLTVRSVLLGGASAGALGLLLASNAAVAQSALLGAGRAAQAAVQAATRAAAPPITGGMQQILARHQQYQARIGAQATAIAQANAAARAAAQAAAQAGQQSVRDGLQQAGLVPVAVSQQNTSALTAWVGASQPTQTANGNFVDVTVNQTQSRALLSWDNFDVGTNTNLIFNQRGNKDWVAVNRVVGGINPATGLLDASRGPKPSEILGSIRADGAVYVLNRAGVLFGATSQVNLNSLVASTLEIGAAKSVISNKLIDRTLDQRNQDYLLNGILSAAQSTLLASVTGEQHGAVETALGSRIQSTGGFVILAAPEVKAAGEIATAVGGQVSLQAGTHIDALSSSGAQSSVDRYVRGLVLASTGTGSVTASGSIDAPQGYISLGTDQRGTIDFSGILTSTTSVSRNGKVSLLGGTVNIGANAAIAITPDTSASTIPQSADSLATFKTSQIDIGTLATVAASESNALLTSQLGDDFAALTTLLPATVDIGNSAMIQATGGDINIGGRAGEAAISDRVTVDGLGTGSVSIAADAVLDVSGMPDVVIDASRNQLLITPAKRNELRDTPTYRETTTDGSFTLNGATLYLDPRVSGVRDDGVTWVGSPLIEAGSLAAQIGVTASELLTKGGNITLAARLNKRGVVQTPDAVGSVNVATGATLDFGGGWVRYQDGFIRRTKLVTADGRIVDIASADRNDRFVGISSGFAEFLPQLAAPRIYGSLASNDSRFEAGYSEGRDAGTLTIQAPTATMNATLFGQAVAGARQVETGLEASAASQIAGDVRKVQKIANELPAGGLLRVTSFDRAAGGSFGLGGAMLVGAAPAEPPADGTIILSDAALSAAGLSGLSLQTTAGVTLAENSLVQLAPGGALNIDAGRAIRFAGTVETAGGSITARTYNFTLGSPFTSDDDGSDNGILTSSLAPGDFDIRVEQGARLSAAGRWINDLLVTDGAYQGPGYIDGGSISLTVAPHVAAYANAERNAVVDLSGSILISAGSLLDVSAGGYVATTADVDLTGRGGDVSLINETVYFQVASAQSGRLQEAGLSSNGSPFQTTPVPDGASGFQFLSSIAPDVINARVDIAAGTIEGFGFGGGGGTFKLVTPDLNFGSSGGTGTAIPLDFLATTGFGTLDLSAWNTAIIRRNVFSNGRIGNTGLLATEQLIVRADETLNLTQSIRRSILDLDELQAVQALASGTDLDTVDFLAPTNQLGDYDNLPAHLVLGGLTELDILGGTVTGAPTASITAPRLYNDGTIAIAGGSITNRLVLPDSYGLTGREALGLLPVFDADGIDQGAGLEALFGPADENGQFDELAINPFFSNGRVQLTNRDVVAGTGTDRQVYYLGHIDGQVTVGANEGLVFAADSVTDLSGTSILDPRAGFAANGSPIVQGRMIAGGSIRAFDRFDGGALFSRPDFEANFYLENSSTPNLLFVPSSMQLPARIVARTGEGESAAQIDLSGASAEFDIRTSSTSYARTPVWSNAGTLSALGGGDIAAATIRAVGGSPNALGGTIEWTNPILSQAALPGTSTLSADQIVAAGFDSLIARGAVSTRGDVSLKLDRSFLLRSRDLNGLTSGQESYFAVSMNAASPVAGVAATLDITAPYISLASINPGAVTPPDRTAAGVQSINALSLSASAIDIAGAVGFGDSLGTVSLNAIGDIRLIGVQPLALSLNPAATADPSLTGSLIVNGDLNLTAAQVYATTGTGNLQQLAENPLATPRPFLIAATGSDSIIRFARTPGTDPTAPLSAGSYLSILASMIEQGGVLRAPLGRIDLGSRTARSAAIGFPSVTTDTVTLLPGSITSVSAAGLNIPYGTTTDLTEYFFAPTVAGALTAPPAASLNLSAGEITIAGATDSAPGAIIDASGGGSIFAYEFVSGVGGSRDVLSRFNSDEFSSKTGFQYPDGRQVYAILPAGDPAVSALYDPLYSSDYADLYGANVGKTVVLESSEDFAGGTYVLMPAKYALNPGALRLVENVGDAAPLPGASRSLLDGGIVVGGSFGVRSSATEAAALGLSVKSYVESTRRSFTVQGQDSVRRYSRIESTSGAQALSKRAADAGLIIPRLPNDAARILLDPGKLLAIDAPFLTDAADGGRGSQIDLAGEIITIVSQLPEEAGEGLYVTTGDLVDLNAASLLIGGIRTDNADGTTDVVTTAREIHVSNDATSPLSAPEIVLAVSGENSLIDITDGAAIVASGTLADTRSGIYDFTTTEGGQRVGIIGSVLRVANGVERLVDISGDVLPKGVRDRASLNIGAATIGGQSALLESSRNISISETATLNADLLALGSDTVAFSSRTFGVRGLIVTPELEATFAAIDRVTVRSSAAVGFTSGTHIFNDLVIDAPGVRALKAQAGRDTDPIDVTIQATDLSLRNSGLALGPCTGGAALACGTGSTGNSLTVIAQNLHLGGGTFRTSYGFDASVSISATGGADYSGVGTLDTGSTALSITTPYIVDLGTGAIPDEDGALLTQYQVLTTGGVTLSGGASALPATPLSPGASLAFGTIDAPVATFANDGVTLRASAGRISVRSAGDISLAGDAILATPSYSQTFGDAQDRVTVSASGGTVSLLAKSGNIDVGTDSRIDIGGPSGSNGAVELLASRGNIVLGAPATTIISAAAPGGGGSLAFDSGRGNFDFAGFATALGSAFTGDISVRTGSGDLTLGAGTTLTLDSLSLTADGGSVTIGGTIDASGISGGSISLFARDAVTLSAGSLLDVHSDGYADTDSRRASAGDIILGAGNGGRIRVEAGAVIDLGKRRQGDRLIPYTQLDPATLVPVTAYRFVEADQEGTLTLRAPVVDTPAGSTVDIAFAGVVTGGRDISVEGYRAYDLAAIASDSRFTGVTIDGGAAVLDTGTSREGKVNFLSDIALGTLPDFVRNFDIGASDAALGALPGLANFHRRPGIELRHSGDIRLASNWNLGAGTVDTAAAIADGDMRVSALSTPDNPLLEVVPGREAHLLENHIDMLYRVGGTAAGEAGRLTIRAGGTLNIAGSITDGFFTFTDYTDPTYIDYQLGGGTRFHQPALQFSCSGVAEGFSCGAVQPYAPDLTGRNPTLPPVKDSINLILTGIRSGEEVSAVDAFGTAPYNPLANTAAALGAGTNGAGNPIGSADIFPLLADGGAVESFSYRLAAGAGNSFSANPLHIDRGTDADLVVSGERAYDLVSQKPVGAWAGDTTQLIFRGQDRPTPGTDIFAQLRASIGKNLTDEQAANAQTRVTFGNGSPAALAFMREAACQHFGGVSCGSLTSRLIGDDFQFTGPATAPNGIAGTLTAIAGFLGSVDESGQTLLDRLGEGVVNGSFGYDAPAVAGGRVSDGGTVRYRSLVRTGTGSIDVVAARDVDLRNGETITYRSATGGNAPSSNDNAYQIGGTALYTAGHVVNPAAVSARVVGTNGSLTIDPSAYLASDNLGRATWVPRLDGSLQVTPDYLSGGGSVAVTAGDDVLGRQDVWTEFVGSERVGNNTLLPSPTIAGRQGAFTNSNILGSFYQRWRVGNFGSGGDITSNIRVNTQRFTSGIGALGGGDVAIRAGGDLSEMMIALDTTLTTGDVGTSFGSMTFGGGDLDVTIGGNLLGGRFDVASGVGTIDVGLNVTASPTMVKGNSDLQVRITDADVAIRAGGGVSIDAVTALGLNPNDLYSRGFYTGNSALRLQAFGDIAVGDDAFGNAQGDGKVNVLPATLDFTSFGGNIALGEKRGSLLYPGATGQLSMLAAGTLVSRTIALDDADPSVLPGLFSAYRQNPDNTFQPLFGRQFGFSLPSVLPLTNDSARRLYHNSSPTHLNDGLPARIAVGGDLIDLTLYTPKATRVSAGRDIIDMIFVGQNVNASDVTRISAGRDITATSSVATQGTAAGRRIVNGNLFVIGGPGTMFVEAGRNMGPFLNSATLPALVAGSGGSLVGDPFFREDYAGGILAVGNDYNPWLAPQSADLYVFFGVAPGADFAALRETYVNPANSGALNGDLFEQTVDDFGNRTPDRSRPIYSPILIEWMQEQQAAALLAAFGTTDVTATQAYQVFTALPDLVQRRFLLDKVYFNELAAPAQPDGDSYLQYGRGYLAVETLFNPALGYTQSLQRDANGAYVIDPETGFPARLEDAIEVSTGNLDLRLAAIETTRNSNITLLGPGGDAILGSVVRTSAQAARLAYQPELLGLRGEVSRPLPGSSQTLPVLDIPLGYEGMLTLRGGGINSFTDGDLRLNQSRLFTQQSGDIIAWSSNGDLNAGQGPKSGGSVPPIVLRFNPNGGSEVDAAGGVVGAGIAGFAGLLRLNPLTGAFEFIDATNDPDSAAAFAQLAGQDEDVEAVVNGKTYRRDRPSITLVAPAGEIDAGDAGVRAAGDIFVAAESFANTDSLSSEGTISGVATASVVTATPASAASAAVANIFQADQANTTDQRSRISVDVLGVYSFSEDGGTGAVAPTASGDNSDGNDDDRN